MTSLDGKIALVTGATRGVGKGVALELAESGAIVYATGRSITEETFAASAQIIPVPCDHTHDREVESVFQRVSEEQGRLDILVNNVWGGYETMIEDGQFTWARPFCQQALWRWDAMFAAGVRAAYVASALAAQMMVGESSGLYVNMPFWAAQKQV